MLPTDAFKIFDNVSAQKRVKIPMTSSKHEEEESKRTAKAHNGQSRMYFETKIVRIMKTNKSLTHNDLTARVMAEAKGWYKAQLQQIKTIIEGLISKEYMERDPTDNARYNYKAWFSFRVFSAIFFIELFTS